MKLLELFNTSVKIDVVEDTDDEFITRADIDGDEYELYSDSMGDSKWGVEFSLIELDDSGREQRSYKLTNKNTEFKVMSFVIQSVKKLIDRHDPTVIYFSAHKQRTKQFGDGSPKQKFRTRADAYERIFSKFPQYTLTRSAGEHDDKFTLRKKDE